MKFLWTSQFFEKKAMYAFNPRRGKVKKAPDDSIKLNYEVIENFYNSKEFLLTLHDGKKVVDKINGVIEMNGPNIEYYALINKMIGEAAEIVKNRKEEWDKQPFKGTD